MSDGGLQVEALYSLFQQVESGDCITETSERMLKSVEALLPVLEINHIQNFINLIVDNFEFFSTCANSVDRISSICSALRNSDRLTSQCTGLSSQTKLFLQLPTLSKEFDRFAASVASICDDKNAQPFLRNVASHCLLEMHRHQRGMIPISSDSAIATASSDRYFSALPQLSFLIGGQSQSLAEYLKERTYSMSPIELTLFESKSQEPSNDPLLLFRQIDDLSKEDIKSIIENPLSQIGVTSVVSMFAEKFQFTPQELIGPTDTYNDIAFKCFFLKPSMSTLLSSPSLLSFVNYESRNAIVEAVFSLALKFPEEEVIDFFRTFFPKSPVLDDKWSEMYLIQPPIVKSSLMCFFSQFEDREAFRMSMLKSEPNAMTPMAIYSMEKTDMLNFDCAEGSFNGILMDNRNIRPSCKLIQPFAVPSPFSISKMSISASALPETGEIWLTFQLSLRSRSENSPLIFGLEIQLFDNSHFVAPGISSLPALGSEAEVTVTMKAIKIGKSNIKVTAIFNTIDGQLNMTTLDDIRLEPFDFLAPSDADFIAAWAGKEETRFLVQCKFSSFVNYLSQTSFGSHIVKEGERVQSVACDPSGNLIALLVAPQNQSTTVFLKAPSIELLWIVDARLRAFKTLDAK